MVPQLELYGSAEAAENVGADVKTDRTIRDRLSQLQLMGFLSVEERNKGDIGGDGTPILTVDRG